MNERLWYGFYGGEAHGDRHLVDLLGGKGANLAEMSRLGLPVPPGFTLPTPLCQAFSQAGGVLSSAVKVAIGEGLAFVESHLQPRRFGDAQAPLLVSVRSGAAVSMPGMMDTVLNIGLTATTLEGLAAASGNRRFALDAYRRLIQMFGDVVRGIDADLLAAPLSEQKNRQGHRTDADLSEADLEIVVEGMLRAFKDACGEAFPNDPTVQLEQAVAAVFGSWMGKRAQAYRRFNGFNHALGTAATVQAMVFGNFGATSATGVVFSRDPSTGAKRIMGEWLPNAQGEDVVAGVRTPGPIVAADEAVFSSAVGSLEKQMPDRYQEIQSVLSTLENHFQEMQDVEFTIEDGRLFVLQTRTGKRTAKAAVKIAIDMVQEGLIDEETAVLRVEAQHLDQLLHPQLSQDAPRELIARGLPASPGAASGIVVFTSEEAEARALTQEAVILVRAETSPEDISGMHAAKGLLTATGGMTSHAAVVARGMGRPCIVGAHGLEVDAKRGEMHLDMDGQKRTVHAGDTLTIDGSTGEVFLGAIGTVEPDLGGDFAALMGMADKYRRLGVRANADSPEDAAAAVRLGAEGIGLCRTEHMFFAPERLRAIRQMILADSEEARERALKLLEPAQKADFIGIFAAMGQRPVTIRLLDPPLHEFLPGPEEFASVAQDLGVSETALRSRVAASREFNPMLGHRGCRLGLSHPGIYAMQVRAIISAALHSQQVAGSGVNVEIMLPLVMEPEELRILREMVISTIASVDPQKNVPVIVGTMIELPRAALLAESIAKHADFFSFGTNDLTQTTLGISRDDAGRFLDSYVRRGILAADPFATIDRLGVGELVRLGVERGRLGNPSIKIGVCGEHGGDPRSVEFFHEVGLHYVSCSAYRIPIARLAAAQAAIAMARKTT